MRSIRASALSAAVLAAASGAALALPQYDAPEVLVGVGVAHRGGIPVGSSVNSQSPVLNDAGVVAVRYFAPNGMGVWRGDAEMGAPVVEIPTPSGDPVIFETAIDNAGDVIWTQSTPAPAVYRYDASEDQAGFFTSQPLGASSWAGLHLLDDGRYAARVTFGFSGNALVLVNAAGTGYDLIAADTGVNPNADVSFLATPDFNDAGQAAARVFAVPGSVDQIRRYDADGSHIVVAAAGQDAPVTSTFNRFFNGSGVGPDGQVAFGARLTAGGSGFYYFDGAALHEIARQNLGGFGSFASGNYISFAPSVNADGVVAFRADLPDGRDVIAVWQDGQTAVVVSEGDVITIDGLEYEIGFGDPSQPAFGGNVEINDAGQVVFNAKIRSGSATVGEAIFLASPIADPVCLADWDGNGVTNVQDLIAFLQAFGAGDADFDQSGATDVQDLIGFLQAFGAGC